MRMASGALKSAASVGGPVKIHFQHLQRKEEFNLRAALPQAR